MGHRRQRTKEQTSAIMKKVRSTGSKMELKLGKRLWGMGLRYRKHYKIIGKPDFAFPRKRVAIFCDSEFWHGYKWNLNKNKIRVRREYWIPKIERNIERDKYVTKTLKKDGWVVIRFWERQIDADPEKCIATIQHAVAKSGME